MSHLVNDKRRKQMTIIEITNQTRKKGEGKRGKSTRVIDSDLGSHHKRRTRRTRCANGNNQRVGRRKEKFSKN